MPDSPHADFIKEVNRRRAAVQAKYIKIILKAADKDEKTGWKAALEFLKSAFPNEYNKKFSQADVNVSGKIEHDHDHSSFDVKKLSDDERDHLAFKLFLQ